MDTYGIVTGFSIAFMIIMVLCSIAMVVIVSLQEGNNSSLGAITGAAESFFGKNRAKTLESKFKRLTIFIGAGILVSSIIFYILYQVRLSLG
jgi:protein translocase, SecG subunit